MFFIHVFQSLEYSRNSNFECLVVWHLSTFMIKTTVNKTLTLINASFLVIPQHIKVTGVILHQKKEYFISKDVTFFENQSFFQKSREDEKQYSTIFWENPTFVSNFSRDNIPHNIFSRDNIPHNISSFSRDNISNYFPRDNISDNISYSFSRDNISNHFPRDNIPHNISSFSRDNISNYFPRDTISNSFSRDNISDSLSRDNISNSSKLSSPTTVSLNWEYFWLQHPDFISANLPNNQQVQVSSNSSLNILPNSAPQNLPITTEISANMEPSIIQSTHVPPSSTSPSIPLSSTSLIHVTPFRKSEHVKYHW